MLTDWRVQSDDATITAGEDGKPLATLSDTFSRSSAGLGLRVVVFWTATTEGTATTAWIKGLRVLSGSAVTATTEGKYVQVCPLAFVSATFLWLVPDIAGFCSAGKAPVPHRLQAAPQGLTLAMQSGIHWGNMAGAYRSRLNIAGVIR